MDTPEGLWIAGLAVAAFLVLVAFRRVAEPNEALIVSGIPVSVQGVVIYKVDDATGYIGNLGKPHAAAVAAAARIAEANQDQQATEAEQAAVIKKAAAWRAAQIKQAEYQAEIDEASARSGQAGPLAEATARQEVVLEATKTAQLEADLAEQRLQSQVRKPADAKAYELRVLAEADRDAQVARAEANARATRVTGVAEADAVKAKGLAQAESARAQAMAEADAIQARSAALAQNQDAVIAQQPAEKWPEIVAAAATSFGNIDHLVVLNGAEGIENCSPRRCRSAAPAWASRRP